MDLKHEKAEKNAKELAELKAKIMSESELEEEDLQDVAVEEVEAEAETEETTVEGSAPSETNDSTEDDSDTDEEDTSEEDEDLTEEDKQRLSEKTRRQMSKLREEARRVKELEEEIEALKKKKELDAPLDKAKGKIEEIIPNLPWHEDPRTKAQKSFAPIAEKLIDQIDRDAEYLEKEYSLFDPTSEDYDDELTQEIRQSFGVAFEAGREVSLRDHAERYIRRIRKAKEQAIRELEEAKAEKQKVSEQAIPATTPEVKKKRTVSVEQKIRSAKSLDELKRLKKSLS